MTPHRGNTTLFRSSQQLPRRDLVPWKVVASAHKALYLASYVAAFRTIEKQEAPGQQRLP